MSEPTPEPAAPPETGEPEPQDGDGDEEEEASEEAQPAPEPPAQQVDMEKALKALGRENDRHEKRVAEIIGEDFATFARCPLDDGMGFLTPDVSIVEAYRYNPETQQLALVSTSATPDDVYLEDATVERCGTCDGRGKLRTGSQVPEQTTKLCADCNGSGYRSKLSPVAQLPSATAQPEPPWMAEARAAGFTMLPPFDASVQGG